MSMAIKRASYTGDPGIFGDIFGALKGAIGGGIKGYLGGRQPPIPTAGPGSVPSQTFGPSWVPQNKKINAYRDSTGCLHGSRYDSVRDFCVPQVKAPGIIAAGQRIFPGGQTGMMDLPNGGAPMNGSAGGYHLNKTSYFLLSGEYVPAGTRWVKNRKRNPANARATSRAISRITGAKNYAKSLSRISIRKKC